MNQASVPKHKKPGYSPWQVALMVLVLNVFVHRDGFVSGVNDFWHALYGECVTPAGNIK